jgi:hypothetical protein
MRSWAAQVHAYFTSRLFPVQPNHGLDLSALSDAKVFVPVVPLFEALKAQESGSNMVLPIGDLNKFLGEEVSGDCVCLFCSSFCGVGVAFLLCELVSSLVSFLLPFFVVVVALSLSFFL